MTWLVTGIKGQLGQTLAQELGNKNIEYVGLNSSELDITSTDQVERVIQRIRPSAVINTAAWTDVDGAEVNEERAFNVNGLAVSHLAQSAKNIGSTLVHISTDYVFSGQSQEPWKEASSMNPQNIYGKSKSMGEIAIRDIHPNNSYIVRTAWLYSEYGRNFAKTMCNLAISSNSEVRVVNDQIGQPTNAQDLAVQIILLINSGAPVGTYHGTNSGQASWFDFACEIFKICGADVSRVVPVNSDEFPKPAKRPKYSVLSHESWNLSGVAPMRDWKISLEEAMPTIISSIKI